MMKNQTIRGRTLAAITTFIILMFCVTFFGMYCVMKYYLYFFLFLTILLCGITNLLFILLKCENTRHNNPKPLKIRKRKKEPKQRKGKRFHKLILSGCMIGYALTYYYCCTAILSFAKTVVNKGIPSNANLIPLLIILIVATVLEKLCKYSTENTTFVDAILHNCRAFFRIIMIENIVAIACVIVESLQLFNIQKYIGYLYTGLFFYLFAFITISLIVTIIRKELIIAPFIIIPIPFIKNQISGRQQGFLDYLEENTGITLRSLWSMKYIRDIAPTTVFMIGLLLWLSTCIVQVNSEQQAAVYRIGNLKKEILEPGLHITLPYPIDIVEVYDTDKVNKVTIGYKSQENTDNIWTEAHQGEEYILLLGGGDEVVSINLRLEYKISDLKQYLTTATSPESVMQALAYELVTDQTIVTDLSSLMSADRDAFSENYKKELTKMLEEQKLGLEVVAVILESIHPPIDIALAYQELISAEIQAGKIIVDAQNAAEVKVLQAETTYDTTVGAAKADYEKRLAEAKSSIEHFTASADAYNTNSDAYTYFKYLDAVKKAYGNANLVIVGEGVDTSALYFGNLFNDNQSDNNKQDTEEDTQDNTGE